MKKNNWKYTSLIFLFFFFTKGTNAQDLNSNIEDIIEAILSDSEEGTNDYDTYLEIFNHFSENRINLNRTNPEELYELAILSEFQIKELFKYLESERKLISIFELQAVPSFDLNTIYRILPFVKVSGDIEDFHVPLGKLLFKGQHQIFMRYSQQFPLRAAYDSDSRSAFLGDPTKLYLRYKYNFGNKISYGITAEKDYGEEFFKGSNQKGFDFYSGHIFFRTNTIFKSVALGDYHLKLGQGLISWTGFATRKGAFTMNVKKTGNRLKPFTSVDEYRFYRGIASTIEVDKFSATPFFSIKSVDANISYEDTLSDEIESVSLQTFGLHRNISEIENKDQVLEMKFGANIDYGKKDRHIGINFMQTIYDKEIVSKPRAYSQFRTYGKSYTNASVDYSYLLGNFHFFGENAISITDNENNKFGYAILNGVLFSADKKVDFSLVQRYYDKKYVTSITTAAFAEATTPNNEIGVYLGTEIRPLKYIKINAYLDVYKAPWLKFRAETPTIGRDFLAQVSFKPKRNLELYFRYNNEEKGENTSLDLEDDYAMVNDENRHFFVEEFDGVDFEIDDLGNEIIKANSTVSKEQLTSTKFISKHLLQKFRLNVKYKFDKIFSFQTRAEAAISNDEINGSKFGFMIFQDFGFKALSFPVSANVRIGYFDINDWDARIYTYENDVLYQFSIPAFNNRGFRTYLNVRYKIFKGIDFWLKLSNTYYTNLENIGSGINEIQGNNQTEIKTQLRFKF